MTSTTMGPPPPRNPHPTTSTEAASTTEPESEPESKTSVVDEPQKISSTTTAAKPSMAPPPPTNPIPTPPETSTEQEKTKSKDPLVPYTIPEWSGPPCHKFSLEILKDGSIIDQFEVCEKGAYMFGRVELCDFILEHPTISRFHAVLQFKRNGDAYLYDLGSTHGTFVNKSQVEKRVYVALHVGDVIRFGHSSRLYIFQGPPDLMPPEADRKILRNAKIRQEMQDQEASLERARLEASLADGISWGMGEDAIQEVEDDCDEVTWQTYKGQLTEKQEKTRDKVIKRTEKIAHMKKEIDAIRAKDIAQGGLTQGQQTQIARNEQRMTQIMEELENLEETLNESIRESIGARSGRISRGKGKGTAEDDQDFSSDDDEFYDRTKKTSVQKAGENLSVETADTLLDKRDAIMKQMEDKKEVLLIEKNKMASETVVENGAGDALDTYMSGLSSQLVLDKTMQLEKELSSLQSELDRTMFLLKIADPSGDAARKRDSKVQVMKPDKAEVPVSATKSQPPTEPQKSSALGKPTNVSIQKQKAEDAVVAEMVSTDAAETDKNVIDAPDGKPTVYTVVKPQWLGAIDKRKMKETQQEEVLVMDESDQFVDYKDRQKILSNVDGAEVNVDSEIESAAPGLIIRKRKGVEGPGANDNEAPEQLTSSSAGEEFLAEDAVALLLKHKRGYHAEDEEGNHQSQEISGTNQRGKEKKRQKRVLGPEKPSFLNSNPDYETWVPPEGQSGDGRTSLNDRYGY
ncbi:PREDICTED: kanadaptin [Populus euphratica]|uniref:Kanadaptin n=1 Tax=Populus euphratica TaxID=75702 RepID=A0AAJ6THE8_POPEU|nr:PREDICTED: kanadaptin [Populus euphratica]